MRRRSFERAMQRLIVYSGPAPIPAAGGQQEVRGAAAGAASTAGAAEARRVRSAVLVCGGCRICACRPPWAVVAVIAVSPLLCERAGGAWWLVVAGFPPMRACLGVRVF